MSKHRRPGPGKHRRIIALLVIVGAIAAIASFLLFLRHYQTPRTGIIAPGRPTTSGSAKPVDLDSDDAISICRDAMADEFFNRDEATSVRVTAAIDKIEIENAFWRNPGYFEVNGIIHYTLSQDKVELRDVLGLTCDVTPMPNHTLNTVVINQRDWQPLAHA